MRWEQVKVVFVVVVAGPVINPSEIPGIETKNENPIYLPRYLVGLRAK